MMYAHVVAVAEIEKLDFVTRRQVNLVQVKQNIQIYYI